MDVDMAALKMAKKQLRNTLRTIIRNIPQESITDQSRKVTDLLISMPEYKAAKHIGIYLSMPQGELVTSNIVRDAIVKEKQVFVPLLYDRKPEEAGLPSKLMDMVSLHSLEDFQACESNRDAWGIPTISKEGPWKRHSVLAEVDESTDHKNSDQAPLGKLASRLDMIVMPGVAFNRDFARLGHGKGFYDLFLQRYRDALQVSSEHSQVMPFLVGLALQEQIMPIGEPIPVDTSDWPLDALVGGDGLVTRSR